jgi:hypothetical protein
LQFFLFTIASYRFISAAMLIKQNEARRRDRGRGRRTKSDKRTEEATEQRPITENKHIACREKF